MSLTKIGFVLLFMISCVGMSSPQAAAQGKKSLNKKKNAVATKAPETSPTPTASETQTADQKAAGTTGEITNREPSVEDKMLDTMLPKSFPERSRFISGEDAKIGATKTAPLSIETTPSLPAATAPTELPEESVPETQTAPQTVVSVPVTTAPEPTREPDSEPRSPAPLRERLEPKSPVAAPQWSLDAAQFEKLLYPMAGGIAGIVVLALLWKLLQKRASHIFSGGGKLSVMAQQSVGARAKLVVVQALGRKYLVGVTDQNVQLVADLDFYETAEDDEDNTYVSPANFEASVAARGVPSSPAADKIRDKVKGLKKI